MRTFVIFLSSLFLCSAGSCDMVVDADSGHQPGFAVVELFTSEGCSSCPPADALLSKLVADSRKNGKPVYPLAFHVDYWNQLGWVDRFSTAAFSRRQQKYAAAMKTNQTYTPQMIINGNVEFVGSDQIRANDEIQSALEQKHTSAITISVDQKKNSLSINYTAVSDSADCVLNIALVERGLQTNIQAGENSNRLLKHENVVREFTTVRKPGKDSISLKIPPGLDTKNASVIAFLQQPDLTTITAATQADLK